jgi:hypothetical protein
MTPFRRKLTALVIAASTIATPAMAAHAIIYTPTVQASTASNTPQGASGSNIVNGVVVSSTSSPGGGTGTSGNATQVTSSTFQNGATNNGTPLHNSTFASANLATGELKGVTASSGPDFFGFPTGSTSARLQDTLYFTNATASALLATLTFSFDGIMSNPFPANANPGGNLGFDVSCAFFNCYNESGIPIQFATGPTRVADGGMNHYFAFRGSYFGENIFGGQATAPYFETHLNTPGAGGAVDGYIRTSILIPTGQTSLGLRAFLNLNCTAASSCDFGNTGKFSFGPLPTGLSYSSASGTFLTGVAGAIPEPATWAMMIMGFGLIGGALRQRKSATRIRIAYA